MRWHDTSLSRTPGTSTLQVSPASCQLQEQTTVNPQLCQNQEEDGRFLGKNYFRLERSARLSIEAGSAITFKPNLGVVFITFLTTYSRSGRVLAPFAAVGVVTDQDLVTY